MKDAAYRVHHLPLAQGDRLVFLTDGMLDRNAASVDMVTLVSERAGMRPREAVQHPAGVVLDATGGELGDDAPRCTSTGMAERVAPTTPQRALTIEVARAGSSPRRAPKAGGRSYRLAVQMISLSGPQWRRLQTPVVLLPVCWLSGTSSRSCLGVAHQAFGPYHAVEQVPI